MADGALRAVLRGHTEQVAAVAFSPDSRHLLTGSWDDDLRVWELAVLDTPATELLQTVEAAWLAHRP
jgi:WD40 repeat protein